MKIYVYCPRLSTGAMDLRNVLGATRLRRFDGLSFWNKRRRFEPEQGSLIICWGARLPELDGIYVLNATDRLRNKYEEHQALKAAGVSTVEIVAFDRNLYKIKNYTDAGYVGRDAHHTGGLDLLDPPKMPDFFVKKLVLLEEYRIHSFAGRSIRAGVKVPRDGFVLDTSRDWTPKGNVAHSWIRSYDGGWRVKYDKFESTGHMRELAHKAVKALGLTFGAVDMGKTTDGKLVVLEVNTAPGLEGGTIAAYGRAVARWIKENVK